ncbi:galactokinase [Zobellia galactanivorans]|uniref:galactokinase n=1 Tax=Zobellia TaxID=112040 RepID=UPI000B5380EB|nr:MULTISPECIES: galactokinase [Zobellia]MBU3027250.1 galactokinase [Zobellia galactanivorans]MDO6807819.1 galactokinase [Zobellia galactanivorans]OWW24730.1 galactokinase [Zobellia sp. OII3]
MQFLEHFTPELVVSSPGRINLIGEHTDYNMGYVLPTAIEKNITFSFKKNGSDNECRVYSKTYDTGFEIDLNAIAVSKIEWENYILGVLNEISKRTDKVRGFDCVVESNLPTGSGLSSSAALECGLAFGLNEIFDLGLSKIEMVQLSQTAEHTYVGTQCGIMDQFASVMSEAGNVILLDCRSLDYKHIPIDLNPYKIILLNTKVSHNLASSEYNTRKKECEEGVSVIQKKYPEVKSLRDVNEEMLLSSKEGMSETVYKRCSFIVKENDRVLAMVDALKKNNLDEVGQILYRAHEGISKAYEVSCPESDFLVDFSKDNPKVLGARQTGGGFGGCTLNIVHGDAVDDFVTQAAKAYKEKFDIDLEAFEVQPSGGTHIIN